MDLSRLSDIFAPSDFGEPASVDHAAMYADGVVQLVASGGFEQVTMGAVARWMGQVPSAVKQCSGGRAGFLLMVTQRIAGRWVRWASRPAYGVLLRLPEHDDELHGVRVWSLVREIAAGEHRAGRPVLAEVVAGAEAREREALEFEVAAVLGRRPTQIEVRVLQCFGVGIRTAMTDSVAPLAMSDAQEILEWVTSRLGRGEGSARPD